jgi:Fe-S cluster assembly protein SufD
LEILNEDVSCTHGATVGPIDPEMVFYLASRGIRPEDAVRTIVTGFVASTLRSLPADLRGRVAGVVADRLEGI